MLDYQILRLARASDQFHHTQIVLHFRAIEIDQMLANPHLLQIHNRFV